MHTQQPTPQQLAIYDWVAHGVGHGLVTAVAGSGKTSTIVEAARRIPSGSVLFCAFNLSIRQELHRRFDAGVVCSTIHALGFNSLRRLNKKRYRVRVLDGKLRQRADALCRKELTSASALDEWRAALVENSQQFHLPPSGSHAASENDDAGSRATLTLEDWQIRSMMRRWICDLARLTLLTLTDSTSRRALWEMATFHGIPTTRAMQKLLYRPLRELLDESEREARQIGVISFEEMLALPVQWDLPFTQYDWVFVDECQDLSAAQLEIVRRSCKPTGRMVFVGDPWQAIYGFIGADPESINRIRQASQPRELPLSWSFRCAAPIVSFARQEAEAAQSALGIGSPVTIEADPGNPANSDGQVRSITLAEYLREVRPGDTVLARRNAPLLRALLDLRRRGAQAYWHGRESAEGVLAALQRVGETPGFRWELRRPFLIATWLTAVAEQPAFATAIEEVDDQYECLLRALELLEAECDSLDGFIECLFALLGGRDHAGAIRLSTIHRIKGLEGDRVFILDLGDIPMDRPDMQLWQRQQEYHLRYVAHTRARQALALVQGPEVLTAYQAQRSAQQREPGPLPCPICGSSLHLRHGVTGPFWGCQSFPACQGKRSFTLLEPCGDCGAPAVLRRATKGVRSGELFVSCSTYPTCSWSSHHRRRVQVPRLPVAGEECPECGNDIVQVKLRTGAQFKSCTLPGCSWTGSQGRPQQSGIGNQFG